MNNNKQKYFITRTSKNGIAPASPDFTFYFISTGRNEDLEFYREVDEWVNNNTKLGCCAYNKSEHFYYRPNKKTWVKNDSDKQWSQPITYEISALIHEADAAAFEAQFSYKENNVGDKE